MSKLTWLKKEIEAWVKSGIISQDQARQIADLYPGDNRNRLIFVLFVLGAVLLGAGVIMFFASNWHYLPKWGKVGLVVLSLILFHLASLLTSGNRPALSAVLSLLGCVMFGSGIWLIAQIFHINVHYPNGILFWILGTLPVSCLLREELPLGLASLLLGIWVLTEHSLSPAAVFAGMVLFAAVYYLTYTYRSAFSLVITLVSSLIFFNTEIFLLIEKNLHFKEAFALIPFIMLLAGSSVVYLSRHPVNNIRYFSFIFNTVGLLTVGIALLLMSFEGFARNFVSIHSHWDGMALLWILYIATAVLGAYVLSRRVDYYRVILKENSPWLILDVVVFAILLVPFKEFYLAVILNLLMFTWALSVIVWGFQAHSNLYFTVGIIFFNVFTIFEYFNFFWKMLPKSLFFIVGGIVLIAGGVLMENKRQKVIESWRGTEAVINEEKL